MTGTVVLSVEVELAWGLARLDRSPERRHSSDGALETRALERLLDRCDEFGVPVTFDVVGHLLLPACEGTHEGDYPADWFADDPGTSADEDPLYYAPALVDRIRDAEVDHEIGTHTFSHPRCDLASAETVDQELRAVVAAHDAAGLEPPRSFVPPMHGPPPTDVLVEHGVTGVREPVRLEPPVGSPSNPDGVLATALARVRESHPVQVLGRSHPVRSPAVRDGLVVHPTTWHASLTAPYLPNGTSAPSAPYRAIPTSLRQRLHERYLLAALEAAAASDGYVHLWTHLFNLANDDQWPPVESFLRALARRSADGEVTARTMASVSDAVRSAHG